MEISIKKNWIVSGLLVLAFVFGLFTFLGVKAPVQTVYASENPKATVSQVHINSIGVSDLNQVNGLTFDDGVLTIDSSFTNSIGGDYDRPAIIYVDTSVTADLTVVANKHPFYAVIANCNGNLTIDGVGLQLCEAYAGQNLTIKANIVSIYTHQYSSIMFAGSRYQSRDSVVYAGEKISFEGRAFVNGSLSSASSIRSLLCAKSLEINTRDRVELSTYSIKGSKKQAPIVFHSCNSANDLADKLVIRQGALKLGKHYDTEDTQYNDYFGFVGYTSNSNGVISNFDTDNKALADYEYAISDKTDDDLGITYKELVVKNRTVTFKKNGGTGEDMDSFTYLPVGKEVTLPECTYTAPEGQHFAGWALGSADGTIKQPGETFVLEEGADPDDWATYDYYPLYATWEDDAPEINYINEIRITSTTTSVVEGALPAFTASTSTLHAAVVNDGNTIWTYWNNGTWYAFGSNPKVAVADGTHYAMRLKCDLDVVNNYEFGDNVTIYFNDVDWTSVGHSRVQKVAAWGGFVYIDLGEAAPTYTVTYYANGSESLDHLDGGIDAGTYTLKTVEQLGFVAPNGKQFKGWSYTSNGEIINTTTITIDGNKDLYAIWEDIPAEQYTVSFNSNGGSGTMAGVQYAGTYTLPVCTFSAPDGKEFDGWALSANGEKITTAQITISADTELFALWKNVEVEPEPQPETQPTGLSAGAVVAIVLASLIVLGVGGFAVYWFVIKKKTWADFVALFKKKK